MSDREAIEGLLVTSGLGTSIHWATRPDGSGAHVRLVIGADGVVRAEPLARPDAKEEA